MVETIGVVHVEFYEYSTSVVRKIVRVSRSTAITWKRKRECLMAFKANVDFANPGKQACALSLVFVLSTVHDLINVHPI